MSRINYFAESKKSVNFVKQESILRPGEFPATIVSAVEPEGYAPGQYLTVSYKIEIDNQIVDFDESFFIRNNKSDRNKNLLNLCKAIDAEYFEDLVGVKLYVTLQYEINYNKKYLNIIDRKLPLPPEGGDA